MAGEAISSLLGIQGTDVSEEDEPSNKNALDALSTTAIKGSDEEDEKKEPGQKRTSKHVRIPAKKGKPQSEERTGIELFVRELPDGFEEKELKTFFQAEGVDVKSVQFIVGRNMGFILLAKELNESQLDKIRNRKMDGKSFRMELLPQKVQQSGSESGTEAKEKTNSKDGSSDPVKDTKKFAEVGKGKSDHIFSDKVQEHLAKISEFIQMLEKHEDLSDDLGLSISRGYILTESNEKRDFGKDTEEYLKSCSIMVKARDTEKLDADGVDKLFQDVIEAHAPGLVLLKHIEEARSDVSRAIITNLRNIEVSHLPILTVGTTIAPDQVDDEVALCFSLRPRGPQ